MAITKKEKAMIEELLTRAALRATSPVAADVIPPEKYTDAPRYGYTFVGSESRWPRVEKAMTTSHSHRIGEQSSESRGSLALYSTELLAMQALRYKVERYASTLLRQVDIKIEELEIKPSQQVNKGKG